MKKKLPNNKKKWINEIIEAYDDAVDTIPFGEAIGKNITEYNLFHLAPSICLKFRGIKPTKNNLDIASEAALCSIIATRDNEAGIIDNSFLSFSLSYLASHYGLNLVEFESITELMNYIEENIGEIEKKINKKLR